MGPFGVESTCHEYMNIKFKLLYLQSKKTTVIVNLRIGFPVNKKCNPIPKRQTRDIFCEMCDIPPHVINILESEYVLFADPPKYYITMCTIYNDWAGWKILFCFLFSKYACFSVIYNVDATSQIPRKIA